MIEQQQLQLLILLISYQFYFVFLQLLRVQSPEGTKRVEIEQSATLRELYEAVHDAFQLEAYSFSLFKERTDTHEVSILE